MHTIRGKITVFYLICLGFIGLVTVFYYVSVHALENKLRTVEKFDDLLKNILEIRRYEKNFTYYGDVGSLDEIVFYLFRVEDACRALSGDIRRVAGDARCRTLKEELNVYKRTLQENMGLVKTRAGTADVEGLRARGKSLLDFAQTLINLKRSRIQKTLTWMRLIPVAFLGSFVALFLVTSYPGGAACASANIATQKRHPERFSWHFCSHKGRRGEKGRSRGPGCGLQQNGKGTGSKRREDRPFQKNRFSGNPGLWYCA